MASNSPKDQDVHELDNVGGTDLRQHRLSVSRHWIPGNDD